MRKQYLKKQLQVANSEKSEKNSKRVRDNTFRALFFEKNYEMREKNDEILEFHKVHQNLLARSLFVSVIIIS